MATATCQASKSCVNPATYSNNFYMHVMSWVGTLCICGSGDRRASVRARAPCEHELPAPSNGHAHGTLGEGALRGRLLVWQRQMSGQQKLC